MTTEVYLVHFEASMTTRVARLNERTGQTHTIDDIDRLDNADDEFRKRNYSEFHALSVRGGDKLCH